MISIKSKKKSSKQEAIMFFFENVFGTCLIKKKLESFTRPTSFYGKMPMVIG
jgi:hypothetical protein